VWQCYRESSHSSSSYSSSGAGRRGLCWRGGKDGEDTGVPGDRRRTLRGMALAGTLAQVGIGLPDGILEPLQQEFQDGRETVGMHLGNVLKGDLTAIEVCNH